MSLQKVDLSFPLEWRRFLIKTQPFFFRKGISEKEGKRVKWQICELVNVLVPHQVWKRRHVFCPSLFLRFKVRAICWFKEFYYLTFLCIYLNELVNRMREEKILLFMCKEWTRFKIDEEQNRTCSQKRTRDRKKWGAVELKEFSRNALHPL